MTMVESYAVEHARRQARGDLDPPYFGALYRSPSGIEWQLHSQHGPGEVTMRRERRLMANTGWFRFYRMAVENLGTTWKYVGPTPEGHYLWGYDLGDPEEPHHVRSTFVQMTIRIL